MSFPTLNQLLQLFLQRSSFWFFFCHLTVSSEFFSYAICFGSSIYCRYSWFLTMSYFEIHVMGHVNSLFLSLKSYTKKSKLKQKVNRI